MPETRKTINIGLVGYQFMGKAHSNAYRQVNKFFADMEVHPVLKALCGRSEEKVKAAAEKFGFESFETDYKKLLERDDVDLIDIVTPGNSHAEIAVAAARAGKMVICEKPLANTVAEAEAMLAAVRENNVGNAVCFNYRRVPAVALAHQFAKEGKLGRIYHVRAAYLQDWGGPDVPLLWRFQKKYAGSGAHGDLNAHIIDMARFISGDEISEVVGSLAETFVKEREIIQEGPKGGIAGGTSGGGKKGKSDVDDALLFLARTRAGAVASFESTRLATGNQNKNGLEINGDKGSIRFNFEDMNTLEFYDTTVERRAQGWANIMVTHGGDHPYVGNWWPDAHIIGYEHGFINQTADMMNILGGKPPVVPMPDFEDAYKTQQVLEAASLSAAERRPVKVSEMK